MIPDEKTKQEYIKKAEEYKEMKAKLESMNGLISLFLAIIATWLVTPPPSVINPLTNLKSIFAVSDGEGVGLFRSEFLYMENTKFPTEEEQFTVYKAAVETLKKPRIPSQFLFTFF